MTVLQDVRDAVIAALNDSPPALVPTFGKRRWLPGQELEAGEFRGAVFFHRESTQRVGGMRGPITQREHTFAVQVVTAVDEPSSIDDALEVARAWVVGKLGDTNLGGLVHDLEEGDTAWETQNLGRVIGAVTTLWRARFQTNRSNLAQRS